MRKQFIAVAASVHRPAAQVVRELMRAWIARQGMPNEETIAAIEAVERGEVTTHVSTADLYRTLGI